MSEGYKGQNGDKARRYDMLSELAEGWDLTLEAKSATVWVLILNARGIRGSHRYVGTLANVIVRAYLGERGDQ